jgi:hypothetical protein
LGSISDPTPQQKPVSESAPRQNKARAEAASVVTATLPAIPTERDKLVEGALEVAAAVNLLIEQKAEQVENRSRDLIRLMLVVRESFKDEDSGIIDEEAFWPFVKHRAGGRSKPKNQWQRLAKACVPKKTKSPQVSKYGYVLAALVQEGVSSETVMDEFEVRDSVAGSDRQYTGLDRFVRLYKAATRDPSKSKNPFSKMSPERLRDRAEFLIEALRNKGMLNPQIEDVDDLVCDPPPEEKRLKV